MTQATVATMPKAHRFSPGLASAIHDTIHSMPKTPTPARTTPRSVTRTPAAVAVAGR
ncbi:hypothetical protein [Streptomyces mirabilis]|uniref:hypothetical protein n=1 Tax=Streptomyces mirabilis TaxID=68239 RepID=UPI00331E3F93